MDWIIGCPTAEATFRLGRWVATHLNQGGWILLTGALGAGKTCFVQGIAAGLNVPSESAVTSPTYTLIHQHRGRQPLVHADFYRLTVVDDLFLEELMDLDSDDTVFAVEWAERLPRDQWPEQHLHVHLAFLSDDTRQVCLSSRGDVMDRLILMLQHSVCNTSAFKTCHDQLQALPS